MRAPAILFLLLVATAAHADDHAPRKGLLRSGVYFDPLFSYTKDRERDTGNGRGGTAALGYVGLNGIAGIEASGYYTKMAHVGDPAVSNGKLEGALIDGLVFPFSQFSFEPTQNFYALLGIGVQTQKIRSTVWEAGIGYIAPIQITEHYSFGVRFEARYRIENQEPPTQRPVDGPPVTPPNQQPPPPEGPPTVQYHDWVYSIGLHIPLSREPEPPPPPKPEPVEVVPPQSQSPSVP